MGKKLSDLEKLKRKIIVRQDMLKRSKTAYTDYGSILLDRILEDIENIKKEEIIKKLKGEI